MIRQGDVQLIKIDKLPKDVELLKGRCELAFGEVTGHAHRINVGQIFEDRNGQLYLKAEELTRVTHEEHPTVEPKKGIYIVRIKRVYDSAQGWVKVKD